MVLRTGGLVSGSVSSLATCYYWLDESSGRGAYWTTAIHHSQLLNPTNLTPAQSIKFGTFAVPGVPSIAVLGLV